MRGIAAVLLVLLAACGGGAGAREACDRAVAALRAGDFAAAAAAAREAADADEAYAPFASFVKGNASFARSERLEAEASKPDAPPGLMERATADAEDAVAFWRAAAVSRADWPEARRNVERGLLRLQRLREKKKGDGGQPGPDGKPPEGTPPGPDTTPPPPEGEEGKGPDLETGELKPEEVRALLELLLRKEALKREARRARRDAAGAAVERDW